MAIAPTPAAALKLTSARIAAALRRAGRKRRVDELAAELLQALKRPQLRQPPRVEKAMGEHARALLAVLETECANANQLAAATAEAFGEHPDYRVITSFPSVGDLNGARLLAEIGDDRQRFPDARALKAYAGSAPITRASGRTLTITRRVVKNNRLTAAGMTWAFSAIVNHPPARQHYDQRRERGDRHWAALRHLFNRMLGQLFHCLSTGQTYDIAKAFPEQPAAAAA